MREARLRYEEIHQLFLQNSKNLLRDILTDSEISDDSVIIHNKRHIKDEKGNYVEDTINV